MGFLDGFLDSGLAGGLVAGGQGFMKGMESAEDRKYKRMEQEAKIKSAETERANKQFDNELNVIKAGKKLPPAGQPVDLRNLENDPEFFENKIKIAQAGANADPFGNKTKPDQGEYLSGGFAKRMEQSEAQLEALVKKGFDPTSDRVVYQGMLGGKGLVGKATEGFKGQDVKGYEQLKRNFISAVLRKESGAAINAEEYASEVLKYFPQRGDSPEVVAQYAQARAQALANLKASAGRAYDRIPTVGAPAGGNGLIKATTKPAPITKEDQEALSWAKKNSKDPRAAEILRANGL